MKFIEKYKKQNYNKNNIEKIKNGNNNTIIPNLENKKMNNVNKKENYKQHNKSTQLSLNNSFCKNIKFNKKNKNSSNSINTIILSDINLSSKNLRNKST